MITDPETAPFEVMDKPFRVGAHSLDSLLAPGLIFCGGVLSLEYPLLMYMSVGVHMNSV